MVIPAISESRNGLKSQITEIALIERKNGEYIEQEQNIGY